jgi:hypothetical protein
VRQVVWVLLSGADRAYGWGVLHTRGVMGEAHYVASGSVAPEWALASAGWGQMVWVWV